MNLNATEQLANQVRRDVVDLTYKAGTSGAHIGGSLSIVEILSVLYHDILKYDMSDMTNESRDRFIMSKGHGAMAQYAVLHRLGILSDEEISSFKKNGSSFSNHPYMNPLKGIEFSTGSLGHGLSLGAGTALSLKMKKNNVPKVFVMMGDGECDEGSIWEAAMSAVHFKLNNLFLIIDKNSLQLDGPTDIIMNQGKLEDKWKSFGWEVYSVDGHSIKDLYDVMMTALHEPTLPTVIIANTIKGKGISFIENRHNWHIGILDDLSYKQAIEELGK